MDEDSDSKPAAKASGSPTPSSSSEEASVKPKVRRKRRPPAVPWKKPKDMPKRPLSAYNLFFKEERERMLRSGLWDCTNVPTGEGGASDTEAAAATVEQSTGKDSASKVSDTVAIPDEPSEVPADRKHEKSSGIGFANLARTIAAKWKNLDAETKAPFEAQASKEKKRYKEQMVEWRAEQKLRKERQAELESTLDPRRSASYPYPHHAFAGGAYYPDRHSHMLHSAHRLDRPYQDDWMYHYPSHDRENIDQYRNQYWPSHATYPGREPNHGRFPAGTIQTSRPSMIYRRTSDPPQYSPVASDSYNRRMVTPISDHGKRPNFEEGHEGNWRGRYDHRETLLSGHAPRYQSEHFPPNRSPDDVYPNRDSNALQGFSQGAAHRHIATQKQNAEAYVRHSPHQEENRAGKRHPQTMESINQNEYRHNDTIHNYYKSSSSHPTNQPYSQQIMTQRDSSQFQQSPVAEPPVITYDSRQTHARAGESLHQDNRSGDFTSREIASKPTPTQATRPPSDIQPAREGQAKGRDFTDRTTAYNVRGNYNNTIGTSLDDDTVSFLKNHRFE